MTDDFKERALLIFGKRVEREFQRLVAEYERTHGVEIQSWMGNLTPVVKEEYAAIAHELFLEAEDRCRLDLDMETDDNAKPIHAIRGEVNKDGRVMASTWCKLGLDKSHPHLIEAHTFRGYSEEAMEQGSMAHYERPLCKECAYALDLPLP